MPVLLASLAGACIGAIAGFVFAVLEEHVVKEIRDHRRSARGEPLTKDRVFRVGAWKAGALLGFLAGLAAGLLGDTLWEAAKHVAIGFAIPLGIQLVSGIVLAGRR
ncbi:MAG: hypothetical protein H6721_20175 [Sandaracinus sp.]|nr:hypothetical protein [Sandaracinus sp.]